jgi:hypothetical protein
VSIPKLSHRDASHVLNDHARRSQAVAIGPRTADGERADRVYLRRQSISPAATLTLQAGLALAASHGRQIKRTAAVNRPARMNAQRGAFCSRTDGVVLSQVQYSWKNGRVACPGLCLRTTMPRSGPSSKRLGAVLRSLINGNLRRSPTIFVEERSRPSDRAIVL